MLIRRGKEEGWLHLEVHMLRQWATASGIKFSSASPTIIPGRGIGLLADKTIHSPIGETPCQILELTEDLVLSMSAIKQHALYDADFRALLQSLGDFGTTPRGAILAFLLFQISISCPYLSDRVGVHCAFTDYVKSLPCEVLPTFWNPEELKMLVGTTLAPAVSAKLRSLQREYDLLCLSAAKTRWYKIVEPYLDFDDWLQVDAMFRSRALEFYGSCMIPGIDLASHAAGERTNAFYDRADGSYFLRLVEGKSLCRGDEVNITYGDEKGACEMLFSYGFLEDERETAETLFLSLTIPENDVSRAAKLRISDCTPGFKIVDVPKPKAIGEVEGETTFDGHINWEGDFVWLLCVNADDGLRFEIARTIDEEVEVIQATFDGKELQGGASSLRRHLAQSEIWPVYQLRAIVTLQQRVFDQLQTLYESQEEFEATPHDHASTPVRNGPFQQAKKLRTLEFELLNRAYEDFEAKKNELAESPVVKRYLASMNDVAD